MTGVLLSSYQLLADPEIPDAPASGRDCPDPGQAGIPGFPNPGIPAKSGCPISRIRDSSQIGMPGSTKSGIPAKSGFKSGKIPIFFSAAAARTVIAHCQRQARLLRFLVGVPGWEKRLIVQ